MIESVEEEVERLLAADNLASDVKYGELCSLSSLASYDRLVL